MKPNHIRVCDDGEMRLLRRALEVAGSVRYVDQHGNPDGYFRELLPLIEGLCARPAAGPGLPEPDGTMEPSQALLRTFVHNLNEIVETFNHRWDELPYWYLDRIGGILDLPGRPAEVWVALEKSSREGVTVGPETGFLLGAGGAVFRPTKEVVLESPTVGRIVAVHYRRQSNLYPASALGCVTEVEVRELPPEQTTEHSAGPDEDGPLFSGRRPSGLDSSPGFIVSSPVLLLREGRRTIHLRLETESHALTSFIEANNIRDPRLMADLFWVEISTEAGWEHVGRVHTTAGEGDPDNLTIRCTLPNEFPPTAGCTQPTHGIEAQFPAVRVRLNLDAWLYPYTWIRDFVLKRIIVNVEVEGLTSLAVYNDLGRVDNSKPFAPFGVGNEPGAWFVVGSYEMAVKHTTALDLHIHWSGLPTVSLFEHYRNYGLGIDNRSFRLSAQYLSDHRWHDPVEQSSHFLFASSPAAPDDSPLKEAPLADSTILRDIPVGKMPRIVTAEEEYDYTIRSRSGFVRLNLTAPDMGFGERRHRELFSQRLIESIGKKRLAPSLPPPIAPLVERITADYRATERIDLRERRQRPDAGFWHIHPIGIRRAYPNRERSSVPLIPSLEGEAHLLFSLNGVRGGEVMHLWFDFAELERGASAPPSVRWFWGDGYRWGELPDDVMLHDTTDNLSGPGMITLDLPERLPAEDGELWFRATVVEGIRRVPALRRIVSNAVRLVMDSEGEIPEGVSETEPAFESVRLQKAVPGVVGVRYLSTRGGGRMRPETPQQKLTRFSGWVTHRGRAVTPRDYERLTTQAFPEIAFVRCFPGLDTRGEQRGVVTLMAIPAEGRQGRRGWRPRLTGTQILRIEEYLTRRASDAVGRIDVINPRYEEVLVRARVTFRPGHSTGECRARLKALCDEVIAPWQGSRQTPRPGATLSYDEMAFAIRAHPCVATLESLSMIRLTRVRGKGYAIHELDTPGGKLRPSEPYAVFVPAREHLFLTDGEHGFGIGEMRVESYLVVEHKH